MFAIFHSFTQPSDLEQQRAAARDAADRETADQRAAEREQQRQRDAAQRRAFAEWQRARQACKRVEEKRRWAAYRRQRAQERASAAQGREQKREQARESQRGSQSRRAAPGADGASTCTTPAERDAYYAEVLALDAAALTPEAVRESYRRLAAGYHPDKVAHLGVKLQELAAAETRRLNEAYAYFRRRYNF